MATLSARHIQDFSSASGVEHHWGYADRVLPCTNDAGSCAYLDEIYRSVDLGNIYTGILWATILGILLIWGLCRFASRKRTTSLQFRQSGIAGRTKAAVTAVFRRRLLPEAARPVFGRTTRLQILILAVLTAYLTVWSFVGITYKTWITPVKKHPGLYNTRTSLGSWSDRVGVLAFALTPLSVMLSSRESLLSLITGVPYQSFNFLHRWLGYIIFVQSSFHTVGWCIIEIRLYQPQPSTAVEWIKQTYMVWGLVAMILLTGLFVLSTPWAIRRTGYEFFRKSHYVIAMLYIGACWGHWAQLNCWMIASLIVWFLDRGVRLLRAALIHRWFYSGKFVGFLAAEATVSHFPDANSGDVVRLDFEQKHCDWKIGQHFYLCFPQLSLWQSHPLTPASAPLHIKSSASKHTYIIRAKGGETKKLATLARNHATRQEDDCTDKERLLSAARPTISVSVNGPYGTSTSDSMKPNDNILCIAGGTGVTFVLPVLLYLAQQPMIPDRIVAFVWAIRKDVDIDWIRPELELLQQSGLQFRVNIFVTRQSSDRGDANQASALGRPSSETTGEKTGSQERGAAARDAGQFWHVQRLAATDDSLALSRHPDLSSTVRDFVAGTARGRTVVCASGPGGMITDLRAAVAACNDGGKVWKGDERHDVALVCDDRLEW